jgi:hypothetical protein
MKGWVRVYRELLDKPIWLESTPEQKTILIALLLMVNHQEKVWEWQGRPFNVRPGQVITSLDSIVQKCGKGISIQNVRTALKRYEKYGFLTDQSTNKNRLITIVNWEQYQKDHTVTLGEVTSNQQTINKPLTTNNNDKEINNDKVTSGDKQRTYEQGSIPYQLSLRLLKNIRKNNPEFREPNIQKWSNEFRLMIEKDNRPQKQIICLIDWCQQDNFWKSNILSPIKLRKHYDRLVLKIQSEKQTTKYNSPQQFSLERPIDWKEPEPLTNEEIDNLRQMEDELRF